jgi:4-methyl-5(b-hydroxyethyl)-thiazole monophosphate biosynthesis
MSLLYVFLAEGFEEVEALAVVDVLRRAKVETKMISITDNYEVKSSHNISIKADLLIKDADFEKADMIFLPGGIPGTPNLANSSTLVSNIIKFNEEGKYLAAICAAPSIYGELGLLDGKVASCYPGYEDKLKGATYKREKFVTDGNIITGRGMGSAIELGLELVRILVDEETSEDIKKKIQLV